MSESLELLDRNRVLELASAHGLNVTMVPSHTEDRMVPGIDPDRANWKSDARELYDGVEARLPPCKLTGTKAGETYRPTLTSVSLTPVYSMPSSWFQHLKWSLSRRWPRLFGRLEVLWTQQYRVPR